MIPSSSPSVLGRYGHVEVSRRHDGSYAVWYCLSEGDLDMISTHEIKRAIEANEPHRNPLRWAIIACTIDRDTARMVERELRDTGLRQFLAHHPEVGSSLRGWMVTGDFGSRETSPSAMGT
jgi:hypothetical protein